MEDELHRFKDQDTIGDFGHFCDELTARYASKYHIMICESFLELVYCDRDSFLVLFKIRISHNFLLQCFRQGAKVFVRDLLGFAHKLQYWSQLDEVNNRLKNYVPDFKKFIKLICDYLADVLSPDTCTSQQFNFVCEQLQLCVVSKNHSKYSSFITRVAVSTFLHGA